MPFFKLECLYFQGLGTDLKYLQGHFQTCFTICSLDLIIKLIDYYLDFVRVEQNSPDLIN